MALPGHQGLVLESYREGTYNHQGVKREMLKWVASMAWGNWKRGRKVTMSLPGLENLGRSPK